MTPLDTAVGNLAARTVTGLERLWEAFSAGRIDVTTFQTAAAALVTSANVSGGAVGALALAANLTARLGAVVAPEPVALPAWKVAPGRLETAVDTILSGSGDPRMQLSRLGRAELVEAVQDGYTGAIARSKLLQGWTRGLEPDACELCTWWAREGRVWPKDHIMPRHKGCECMPEPVLAPVISGTSWKGKNASADRAANGLTNEWSTSWQNATIIK